MSQTQLAKEERPKRLASLDQFRGYTVFGMLLVNYLGGFSACPKILKHSHDYCSYADTIMPHFLFAVGFSLRLSYGRKCDQLVGFQVFLRILRRILGLLAVSLLLYSISPRAESWEQLKELGWWGAISTPLKREWFQTLTHIAATTLWILPVIHHRASIRWVWLIASSILHLALSYRFNFEWVNTDPKGIDGGPLGFLTWSVPALVGSLACDWFAEKKAGLLHKTCIYSTALMLIGYGLSCGTRLYDIPKEERGANKATKLAEHPVIPNLDQWARWSQTSWSERFAEVPFLPPPDTESRKWNYWMMSQRSGSLSYLVFSTGFSLLVYLIFFYVCDQWGRRSSVFRTLGSNALLAYIIHDLSMNPIKAFVPKDSPAWYVIISLIAFFLLTWGIVRSLEKQGVYLRA